MPEKYLKSIFPFIVALLLACTTGRAKAFNVRQTTGNDGLSSCAILSMAQDENGFLWLGTLDGVNITDGSSVRPLSQFFGGKLTSGNLIERIVAAPNGLMWIQTNHGLNYASPDKRTIGTYPQFLGQELLCADNRGNVYILSHNNTLYTIAAHAPDTIRTLAIDAIKRTDIKAMRAFADTLYLYGNKGAERIALRLNNLGTATALGMRTVTDTHSVKIARPDSLGALAVDHSNTLGCFNRRGQWQPIANIANLTEQRGEPTSLLQGITPGTYFVSFAASGAVMLHRDNATDAIKVEDLGVEAGVFCLEASDKEPVVWIGSDCHGLFTLYSSNYNIRSMKLPQTAKMSDNPIRSLFLDNDHSLWVGTKGGGILRVPGFPHSTSHSIVADGTRFTSSNSQLSHNSVFAFSRSKHRPVLWIVTEDGVDYYSYTTNKIHPAGRDDKLKFIHAIYEASDSVMWLATVGNGIIKCRIKGSNTHPTVEVDHVYTLNDGDMASNYFFSLTASPRGQMLFINRGKGTFTIEADSLKPIRMSGNYTSNAVMDAFCAVHEDSVTWIGTGHGLLRADDTSERLFFGLENGFVNNTIHHIEKDSDGALWISTNNGLYRFDPKTEQTRLFGNFDGVAESEFSDGAGFNADSLLIFGGVDGLVTVAKETGLELPDNSVHRLYLTEVAVNGENVDLREYITYNKDGEFTLTLAPDHQQFNITFATPNFVNPAGRSVSYSLDGREWINNGPQGIISFNGLSYGHHQLEVKAMNHVTGKETNICRVDIHVTTPWYLSTVAIAIYILILLSLAAVLVWSYLKRLRRKRMHELSEIRTRHREEVYEEKLRFFTNITHEFCTPLTLIYGPCERIADYKGTDSYIRKYIEVVLTNVERLNTLIQELIDFRRIETGNKTLKIRPVDITELCNNVPGAFAELAERNCINFTTDIEQGISWNTDFSSLRKVIMNLVSNAFKYTPNGGTIRLSAKVADDKLRIEVYNTGKGIKPEDCERIFNRYSILDNVEENAVKGISARNGLGMAICHSIVTLLSGSIDIESEVGEYATFVVTLPRQKVNTDSETLIPSDPPAPLLPATTGQQLLHKPTGAPADKPAAGSGKKAVLLVIDDNREILSLLAESLSDYTVLTAASAAEGLEHLKTAKPSLIITDVMMPGTDGLTLARQIKQNKHTMHLPLIILSAKTSVEEKVEGIESGADAYVGKPFSISYLRALICRLLSSRRTLREYYNSSASAFEFNEGKLMEKTDRDFLERVAEFIDSHIGDSDLSPETLAAHLQTSPRNLYRRFKELDQPTPNDYIKDRRIAHAAKLLLTTSLTVQEIIFKVGFSNRTHFYKEFDKRFGTTPKDYRTSGKTPDTTLGTR